MACRLTVYGYWNEGGLQNVVSMLVYICKTFFCASASLPAEVQTTPQNGCLHPKYSGYFASPAMYLDWYQRSQQVSADAPVVAVLLYRKHVITQQPYIPQLITQLEKEGLLPVPIFINGVEAHTIVRDQLTSSSEQAAIAAGASKPQSLRPDAIKV
jgi:magnesium chelatase subunit H